MVRRVIVKLQNAAELKTNRERPKSAPYLRLKKAKGLQSIKYSFTVPEKLKGGPNWRAGGPFRTFHPFVAKHQKNEGGPFGEKIEKSHNAEKTERGKSLFWSVRVDWKKVSNIVEFHFMKRQLKTGRKPAPIPGLSDTLEQLRLITLLSNCGSRSV